MARMRGSFSYFSFIELPLPVHKIGKVSGLYTFKPQLMPNRANSSLGSEGHMLYPGLCNYRSMYPEPRTHDLGNWAP